MRDRNIVVAVLVCSMLALAACGGINSAKTGGTEEAAVQSTVEMPNPWSETTDLDEAEKAAGVDFDPPVENSLPEGYEFVTYRCMDGLLETVYKKGEDKIVIRVSTKLSGEDLNGDYNNYSKEWEENFKGLTVKCKGDGTLINCANADVETTHFAVLINPGQEGKGLTADELKSIFMGMQAGPLEAK
jgi:hypothetical protein